MLKLAARNLFRQRTRTGLTLAVIVLGVTGLILSSGFITDTLAQLRESTIHSRLGHLHIYKDGFFANGGRNPYNFLFTPDPALVAEIGRDPRVEMVTARLFFFGLLSNGHGDLPIIGEGVNPEKELGLGSAINMLSGRLLKASDADGILVGEGLAQAMKLKPGDHLTLLVNTREGALNTGDFNVIGVFRTFSRDYDARAVRIKLRAAQDLIAEPGVNALVLLLKKTELTDAVAASLAAPVKAHGLELRTWTELADFYTSTVALFNRQFGVLQVIILALVLLGVANSISMTLHERVAELGTMRALGRRQRDVFVQLVIEYSLLGLVGATVGAVVGLALAAIISSIGIPMPPPPNSEEPFTARIAVDVASVGYAFAVGWAATVLAVLWPAWRAQRVPVAEALRQSV
jgi:putative ABC transport system permease protein